MLEVFRFECRYQLRSPLFLILAFVFFLLAFMLMASENVSLGGVGNNLNLNAAWTIVFTQFFFSTIGMLATVAIVASAITRDYELATAEILFSSGISPRSFLLGRFFAGTLFATLVGVAAILGTLIATLMPWLDQERVGEFVITPYVYALCVVTVPNFFFSGAFFFAVAALSRSLIAAFAAAVGFFVLNIVVGFIVDPEQLQVLALIDPFGGSAFAEVSRYWTVFERNTGLVPITGNLLANRLIWVGVGIAALAFTVWRFAFNLNPSVFQKLRRKTKTQQPPAIDQHASPLEVAPQAWRQFVSQVRMDLAGVYKSVPFYAVMAFALLNVWGGFQVTSSGFGIPLLPTTGAMLRAIAGAYSFFIIMILIYYAGELVHRERQTGVAEVVDAMPFANGVMVASKVVSLWFVVVALFVVATLAAVVNQLTSGYTNLELDLYLVGLFYVQCTFFLMIAVLGVFIQVVSGNKWIGMVAMVAVFLGFASMSSFGFEHALYNFGPPWGLQMSCLGILIPFLSPSICHIFSVQYLI